MEGQTERKDNRRTFSVSKAFEDVHKILDELPANEASRFICEAIRHYHQVKNNPNWMGDQFRRLIGISAELQTMLANFGGQGQMPVPPYPGNEQTGYGSPYMQQPMQYSFPHTNTQQTIHHYAQPGMMPYESVKQGPPVQPMHPSVQHPPTSVDGQPSTTDTEITTVEVSSDPSHNKDASQDVERTVIHEESEVGDTLAVEKGERIPNRTTSSSDENSDGNSSGTKENKPRKKSSFARSLVNKSQGKVEN